MDYSFQIKKIKSKVIELELLFKSLFRMMEPIENLQLNKEYKSRLQANTDLHAGGIFFCILYEESIIFYKNGKVEIRQQVFEEFRPMDQHDIDRINNFKKVGKYRLNSRKYIECEFEDLNLVGLPLIENKDIISFHSYNKKTGHQNGEVYKLIK